MRKSRAILHRVHLYVHGRGRGHATRCLAIARALQQADFDVAFTAGRDVASVLAGFDLTPVDSLPPRVGLHTPGLVARRVREARRELRRIRPTVVVSDGDLPGAVAAKSLGIPVVAIGHGLTFVACRAPMMADRAAWRREAVKAWVASAPAQRLIAVNFVPLVLRRDDAILARPALELPPRRDPVAGKVLCYFRDAPVRTALEALLQLGKSPVSYGREDPGVHGVVHHRPGRPAFLADLAEAEAVVATAGSQLMSECIALQIPFFGLYEPGDDEQSLNVAMLRAAGLGDGVPSDQLSASRLEATLASRPERLRWEAPTIAEATVAACRSLDGSPPV